MKLLETKLSNTKHSNKAYSREFIADIINHMKKGESAAKLSQELNIATSTLSDCKKQASQIMKSLSELQSTSAKKN